MVQERDNSLGAQFKDDEGEVCGLSKRVTIAQHYSLTCPNQGCLNPSVSSYARSPIATGHFVKGWKSQLVSKWATTGHAWKREVSCKC
jgi:hypothetical protein